MTRCATCDYSYEDERENLRMEIDALQDECGKLEVTIATLQEDLLFEQGISEFRDKIADMLDFTFLGRGKEYLLVHRLEDILKEYRQLKDKGVTVLSEMPIATERTPDDRNCSSAGCKT